MGYFFTDTPPATANDGSQTIHLKCCYIYLYRSVIANAHRNLPVVNRSLTTKF